MMLTRDEILAIYQAGHEGTVALVEALQYEIAALTQRVEQLEARLNKDSHNSNHRRAMAWASARVLGGCGSAVGRRVAVSRDTPE
jgi:hypothetical protein